MLCSVAFWSSTLVGPHQDADERRVAVLTDAKGQGPNTPDSAASRPGFFGAYARAANLVSVSLAPFLLFNYLKDLKEIAAFVKEHPWLGILALGIFFSIVIAGLSRRVAFLERAARFRATLLRRPHLAMPLERSRGAIALALFSSVAIGLVVMTLVIGFTTSGVYYAWVSSVRGRDKVQTEVSALQAMLARGGIKEHSVKSYRDPDDHEWYMITLGGPHLSRESANRVLEQARPILRGRMARDAVVYTAHRVTFYERLLLLWQRLGGRDSVPARKAPVESPPDSTAALAAP